MAWCSSAMTWLLDRAQARRSRSPQRAVPLSHARHAAPHHCHCLFVDFAASQTPKRSRLPSRSPWAARTRPPQITCSRWRSTRIPFQITWSRWRSQSHWSRPQTSLPCFRLLLPRLRKPRLPRSSLAKMLQTPHRTCYRFAPACHRPPKRTRFFGPGESK